MSTIAVKPPGVIDPLKWQRLMWPHINFYDKQRQIIYSVDQNDETVSPAGNMLGKDYVSAFIALWAFCSRHPVRIITTSVKDDHLRVLWGEIGQLIATAKHPLRSSEGGNLICNHQEIRKIVKGEMCSLSYLKGMVASEGAAMQGHHIAKTGDRIWRTLFICDEASGVNDEYHKMASTWAERMLIIGNPWECSNFFKHAVKGKPGTPDKGGDVSREDGNGYYRKIIKICGEDSPNVRYGLKEKELGRIPSDKIIIPGVLSYAEYVKRRKMWDKIKQQVSIDGEFYEGAENLMYPPEWLGRAERIAADLHKEERKGRAIGCDPGEGGAESSWSVVDDYGLIEMLNIKTPDTNIIPDKTIALMKRFGVKAEDVWFDRGGGGKQHVDRMRAKGYNVRTVAFGEAPSEADLFKRYKRMADKRDEKEDRTTFKNRRAEMYWLLRCLLDPSNPEGFGLPEQYYELRRQLAPIPLRYGRDGVLYMLPKHKDKPDSKEENLYDLLGCSPDEADSLVLAVFGLMMAKEPKPMVGAITGV